MRNIRAQSIKVAKRLGYATNGRLPLLGEVAEVRNPAELGDRILCLNAVVASAWGHPKARSIAWLKRERLWNALSGSEVEFLEGRGIEDELLLRVEALWALLWCACIAEDLDFSAECSDDLVTMVPDLRIDESVKAFRARVVVRDKAQIISKCDLAYCLHWAIKEAALHGADSPGVLDPVRVVERRRALEWMIGSEDWDDVSLDT
jgi:hypothetical protein